ncbi:MAG TPA: site-2 protease family protein [Terriglobales bacterium]|jgi:Zn-dependent protease|nr:site-2 protease family protein [Terriglobales bacterium]
MSEPSSTVANAVDWEDQPQSGVWIVRQQRQRWWLYGLFFVLTLLSTTVVGARMQYNFLHRQSVFSLNDDSLSLFPIGWIAHHPANLLLGLPFSLTLMFILFAHEMGHYLYARRYRVYVTPPLFVPCPYLSLFGTLGAFIRIKSSIPSRAALFDIGIAGPLAGFIPACISLLYGLSLSRPMAGSTTSLQLGFPWAFYLASHVLHISVPLSALSLHPIAAAAWVGMFATALNLLPVGQLDGGHIIFSISPRWHRWISLATIVALIPLGKYRWLGWLVWAVLLTATLRHPRVPRYPDASGGRRVLALCALVILMLTFTPAPLENGSGREVWPQIRDGSRDTLHDLRDHVRELLRRK